MPMLASRPRTSSTTTSRIEHMIRTTAIHKAIINIFITVGLAEELLILTITFRTYRRQKLGHDEIAILQGTKGDSTHFSTYYPISTADV